MLRQISDDGLAKSHWGYRVTVASHDQRRAKDPPEICPAIKFEELAILARKMKRERIVPDHSAFASGWMLARAV
jgi:hypothetical protein